MGNFMVNNFEPGLYQSMKKKDMILCLMSIILVKLPKKDGVNFGIVQDTAVVMHLYGTASHLFPKHIC